MAIKISYDEAILVTTCLPQHLKNLEAFDRLMHLAGGSTTSKACGTWFDGAAWVTEYVIRVEWYFKYDSAVYDISNILEDVGSTYLKDNPKEKAIIFTINSDSEVSTLLVLQEDEES